MMHRLDLNQLRILDLLLKKASVKLTAAELGVSQAAVSRTLKSLRAMFNDYLLIKTKSGMVPTKRAEQLRQPLQEWLEQTQHLATLLHHGESAERGNDTCATDLARNE